ncbi:MAG: right-handed parallel beta-helix repeat-containing protein [Candidatus Limnocylindrales bacterium]
MFWDGYRWVDERPALNSPPPERHRVRDWLATIPILLLVPALVIPIFVATTASPSLKVTGDAIPGHTLRVDGTGFPASSRVQLLWDKSSYRMPSVRVDSGQHFSATFQVPTRTKLGDHVLSVASLQRAIAATGTASAAPSSGTLGSRVISGGTLRSGAAVQPMASFRPGVALQPQALRQLAAVTVTVTNGSSAPAPTATPGVAPAQTSDPAPTAPPAAPPTATPTAPPVPTSAPAATAAPTVAPTPPPSSPWSVPFLGRTPSGQVVVSGKSNVTVSGLQFVGLHDDAIVVEDSSNVTITANDFSGDVGGVYCINSTNVTVTYNRFQNIGDGTIGSGHSNYVQFNACKGGYIAHNKGVGGNTEDIISIYESGGADAAHPLIVEYNAFEGTNWSSGSGSGTMSGDASGSHIIVRNNTYLSPGQVGIGVPGGTDIHILNNTIYGATRPSSNVGIYVWNQSSSACSGIEVGGNKVKWFRDDGVQNPAWDAGNCGSVASWSTNDWSASIDPATLHVTL